MTVVFDWEGQSALTRSAKAKLESLGAKVLDRLKTDLMLQVVTLVAS